MGRMVKEGCSLRGASGQGKGQAKDARVPGTHVDAVAATVPRLRAEDVSLSRQGKIGGRDSKRFATNVLQRDREMLFHEPSHAGRGDFGWCDRNQSIM